MTRRATISPLAARRRNAPPRALVLTQPQPTVDQLLRVRDHLERQLGRRPLTVGQVWAIGAQLADIDRQLDTRETR